MPRVDAALQCANYLEARHGNATAFDLALRRQWRAHLTGNARSIHFWRDVADILHRHALTATAL